MERVGVVVHPTRPVVDAVEVVESWVSDRGLELVQVPAGTQPRLAPAGQVEADDPIVALGGDGTILKALHASAARRTPVLGVAYGSLGALTTVPTDELRAGLDRFAAGEWRGRELPALSIHAADEQVGSALNDIVVARGRGTQLMLDLYVNGELYVRLAGDGVAVATPLGSSAYSMAAGGSLLTAGADAVICTPLAMHGGCAPPLVAAGAERLTLEIHPGHSGFTIDVDGFPLETDSLQLEVGRQHSYATLVALDDPDTGLPRLRARGLITDSPRVLGQDRRVAHSTASPQAGRLPPE
jgi:NAD+ kinase